MLKDKYTFEEINAAHYTTIQAGFHVTKKVEIDNGNAEIEVTK